MVGLAALPSTSAPSLPYPGCRRLPGSLHRRTPPKVGRCISPVFAQLELKPPPYPLDALEPYMSRQTLEFHWGKHHRGYVDNLNKQIGGTELDGLALEEIVIKSYNKGDLLPTFNNAAQIWNHDFFWQSMKPGGGGQPSGVLLELIERDFGSVQAILCLIYNTNLFSFEVEKRLDILQILLSFSDKANKLDVGNAVNPCPTENDYKLVIEKTPNAVNPLVWDYSPLLVVDVWEHAYYLDYQNRRPDFVSTFIDKLISWDAVSARLELAMAQAAERAEAEKRRTEADEALGGKGEVVEMYVDSGSEEE